MEKEIRYFNDIELRKCKQEEESRLISGYGLVFNSLSHDLGGFREKIAPGALEGVLEKSDIRLLLNHDDSRGMLARNKCGKGSLKLEVDEKGLRFETEAPFTSLGDEVLEYLRRGDMEQCSFGFTVESDYWEKQGDGSYIRTINKFDRIFDVSVLTVAPAYEATSVSCRSFEDFKAEEQRLLDEAKKAEEEKRQAELDDYYTELKNNNAKYLEKK